MADIAIAEFEGIVVAAESSLVSRAFRVVDQLNFELLRSIARRCEADRRGR